MRTYNEALEYSMKNPTELVEYREFFASKDDHRTGFLLNRKHKGLYEYYRGSILQHRGIYNSETSQAEHVRFRTDGTLSIHYFSKDDIIYGEYKYFKEDGTVTDHYFCKSGAHIEELDYLLDEDRDDAFYFTLSLHGIDKEYTFQ